MQWAFYVTWFLCVQVSFWVFTGSCSAGVTLRLTDSEGQTFQGAIGLESSTSGWVNFV